MGNWKLCPHCLGGGCGHCGFGQIRIPDDDPGSYNDSPDPAVVKKYIEPVRSWVDIYKERFKGHDYSKRLTMEEMRAFRCLCKKPKRKKKKNEVLPTD